MPRRIQTGRVISTKMDKTIVVSVERRFRHPLYGKYVRSNKKYMAHDAENQAQVGQMVRIEECRPLSRRKSWKVLGLVSKLDSADATSAVSKLEQE